MKKTEIKRLICNLYNAINISEWSAHKYYDGDWHNLMNIRYICNAQLPDGWRFLCQFVYGYNKENTMKSYLFTVENIDTGERIIDALVAAHAAGTVSDHWSAYDCTCTFWEHEA